MQYCCARQLVSCSHAHSQVVLTCCAHLWCMPEGLASVKRWVCWHACGGSNIALLCWPQAASNTERRHQHNKCGSSTACGRTAAPLDAERHQHNTSVALLCCCHRLPATPSAATPAILHPPTSQAQPVAGLLLPLTKPDGGHSARHESRAAIAGRASMGQMCACGAVPRTNWASDHARSQNASTSIDQNRRPCQAQPVAGLLLPLTKPDGVTLRPPRIVRRDRRAS